eukprot:TRINITY_DN1660_c0_g1_i3.p1 TRINITY_DN1660_c0_g1~~TRINITY_DN1660_c0_g1_i3.p1  ORF type:complete len:279 (+),score=68.21 TRINITY_DN1660_c0_g1_i3:113-838(+)
MAQEMHADLKAELAKVRGERAFDVKKWIDQKTDMFNDYLNKNGLKAACVSLSGGVDSAVTFALMLHASKKANSPLKRVVGIAQPIHSTKSIMDRAYELGKALNGEVITVDQSELHTQLCKAVEDAIKIPGEGFARGQLRSYMRTPVGFYVAQLISQSGLPCVVLGTGNQDEDGYLMYFCKAGDGVADIQLIADLHKSEVFTVGKELGVVDSILVAPPSADLWDGQTDEDELGFTCTLTIPT